MTLVSSAGATQLTSFTVPVKGTISGIAAHQVPPDALFSSMNVFIRRGKLRERPGLTILNNTTFDAPVIGGAMAVTPYNKILLATTKSQLYTLDNSNSEWQSDTVIDFALDNDNIIDTTFLETMNTYVAIFANSNYPLKAWQQGSGVTAILGAPNASSVCTATRRIIALIPPHTLRWTATLTYDNWPLLAIAKIAQTNDVGICVKSLGTLDFVVYKERSLYIAKAQPGDDASAFNIQFVQSVEGPAGIHAVVDAEGTHFYMTKNGRVGVFDGTGFVKWIADGVWLQLQDDIDPGYIHKIFGVYDYRLHTVTFHYPKANSNGAMYGMLILNLNLQDDNLPAPYTYNLPKASLVKASPFIGISNIPCSFGYEMRLQSQIDRSIIFTSSTINTSPQSFIFDVDSRYDDSISFDCAIQTGLFSLPEMRHHHVSVESFLERADSNSEVNIFAVMSDILENESGNVNPIYTTIDLNINPVREYIGFDIPTRFVGLRYEWSSMSKVRYAGAMLYGKAMS